MQRSHAVRGWRETLDFAARIAFFATAPFVVFVLASVFPVIPTLVNVALCLVVVSFADMVRTAQRRVPALTHVLTGPLEFEKYYRLHAPKPFAYYIFFPFLFPYWLANDSARREFLLYKTVNLVSLAFLVGTSVYEYFAYFRPELGVRECVIILLATGILETATVMIVLMPLATSIVKYRLLGRRDRLITLIAVGAVSVGLAIVAIAARRDPVVSWAARERVILRTQANKPKARVAQVAATKAAWAAIPTHKDDIDPDGKVEGAPIVAARDALKKFYKTDEAQAFDAWVSHGKAPLLILYVEGAHRRPPMFVALDRAGHEVKDQKKLPKGALSAMKLASDGIALDL